MIFAAGKSRLVLATAAGLMLVHVPGPGGAQSASLKECQTLAEFFSQAPAIITVDQLGILQGCVADYRAQRDSGSPEKGAETPGMGAGEFSGGTPTFKKVPPISRPQLNLPKSLLQK
jgi:hypothetical protein